jgi:hypothetical protein
MAQRARVELSSWHELSRTDPSRPNLSHQPSSPLLHHGSRRTRCATVTLAFNAREPWLPFLVEQEERIPERAVYIDTRSGTNEVPELEPAPRTAAEAPTERSDA